MRLTLASTSPARLALLRSSGIEPVIVPSSVDEDRVVAEAEAAAGGPLDPGAIVALLAQAKAEASLAVVRERGESVDLILGGDSVFVLDGVVNGKPHTAERARERWLAQRGRTGTLFSGHWLIDCTGDEPRAVGSVASADVTFADDIDDDEIDAYIASGEPLLVAGAFTIDSLGAAFITRIDGDPSTVVGMSLPTLRRLVRSLGHDWHELRNRAGAL
ncbi:Maf family protein [Plantibacter sp. YIM 135347]|uniref:Maf family protein n=1 Tax=Plantibacter sp. YIM 135347 TaxID=3423919 RepID=UPI003D34A646